VIATTRSGAGSTVRYGISTHLYHDSRLSRDHLIEIASYGFDQVEVFAARTHFDYHDARAITELEGWLREAGLSLHSIHAPIVEEIVNGRWIGALSLAAADPGVREHALGETAAAIEIARQIPTKFLVVHLGVPEEMVPLAGANLRDAALDSLERIVALAEPAGLQVAVELIANELSGAAALVEIVEDDLELPNVGICLDFGHAALEGDVVDAVEMVAGLLVTTHVHDTRGRSDDHLVPFEGTIHWPSVLTSLQKVGYEGTLMFEVAGTRTRAAALERTRTARERFDEILGDGMR
jgi:sugar phosphate isomerase/epimerase